MKLLVLGAGRVGSAMAIDLSRDSGFEVHVADRDTGSLDRLRTEQGIPGERVDFSLSSTVRRAVENYDLVISAVPGFLGYQTLKSVIEAGKPVVDIAFFPENPFELNDLAIQKGVVAVVDCGVAPGMSNLLVGHVHHLLDSTEEVEIYVGGLPVVREWPMEYRAVFSPIDVIEEYTRPARLVEGGAVVTKPALTELEQLGFPGIGTLEAFNTDGLRTLIDTIDAPTMKEKTLRYPGHVEKVRFLRHAGFFSETPIEVSGHEIRPIDLTTSLLFPMWQLKEGEEDVTVMRISVTGLKAGVRKRYTYDLFDRYDLQTSTTSMARTTGYTATVVARLLRDGVYDAPGVHPPEHLAPAPGCVDYILKGLAERGIAYQETIEDLAF